MIIRKSYKFYAAHRNAQLDDKCRNLHGHRYGIFVSFRVERSGSYTTLFNDFDSKIEPFLKQKYDHAMLVDRNDPLFPYLKMYEEATGDQLRFNVFDFPTTVENIAFKLFTEFTEMGFSVEEINVKETDTSEFLYTREDWVADQRRISELAETNRESANGKTISQFPTTTPTETHSDLSHA